MSVLEKERTPRALSHRSRKTRKSKSLLKSKLATVPYGSLFSGCNVSLKLQRTGVIETALQPDNGQVSRDGSCKSLSKRGKNDEQTRRLCGRETRNNPKRRIQLTVYRLRDKRSV